MFCNFFIENCAVYEIMQKNVLEWGRPQMRIWYVRIACWMPKATQIHTLTICNIYCFTTTTFVTRTRLNDTLCVPRLSR